MIPDYQSIMLPLLKQLADQKEHSISDLTEALAIEFQLTEDERRALLGSGAQTIFHNRVGWAKTYLKKAGLLNNPRRAVVKITPRGIDTLGKNLNAINVTYLKQFPEFVEFQSVKKTDSDSVGEVSDEAASETPEEILDRAYRNIRETLAQELITKVLTLSPAFFERLVVELLVKMGYGGSIQDAGKAIGKSGDGGIDGTIKEDKLGLDIIYIQAKRWNRDNTVGRPEIQKFVGALAGQGAKKGVFITTSSFTKEALDYTPRNETKVVLIDGEQLAQLMIDYNLGVTSLISYEVKRIDSDYFDEE
jgi:restriction system protein